MPVFGNLFAPIPFDVVGRLRPFGLRRVHRTRLVNLDHVAAVEPRPEGDFILRMDSGELIAGSRRYREAVRAMTAPSA